MRSLARSTDRGRRGLQLLALSRPRGWVLATAASQHPHRALRRPAPLRPDRAGAAELALLRARAGPARLPRAAPRATRGRRADRLGGDDADHAAALVAGRVLRRPPPREEHVRRRQRALTLMAKPQRRRDEHRALRAAAKPRRARVREEHAREPPPRGFQFLLARHTGHDESERARLPARLAVHRARRRRERSGQRATARSSRPSTTASSPPTTAPARRSTASRRCTCRTPARRSSSASARGGWRCGSPSASARSSASTRRRRCSPSSRRDAAGRGRARRHAQTIGDGGGHGLVYCVLGLAVDPARPRASSARRSRTSARAAAAPGAAVVIETHNPAFVKALHGGRLDGDGSSPTRRATPRCCRTARWTASASCGSCRTSSSTTVARGSRRRSAG